MLGKGRQGAVTTDKDSSPKGESVRGPANPHGLSESAMALAREFGLTAGSLTGQQIKNLQALDSNTLGETALMLLGLALILGGSWSSP